MFDGLINWAAGHAAEMLVALVITGVIAIASEVDARTKDAGKDAPMWLRVLSIALSKMARNVKHAANDPKAQALALICILPLALACTTIEPDNVQLSYGTNEAYNISGPNIEVNAEGGITCTSPDPVNYPCRAQYAAGWEAWEQVIKALALPFEAVLQLFGRTLVPGPAG